MRRIGGLLAGCGIIRRAIAAARGEEAEQANEGSRAWKGHDISGFCMGPVRATESKAKSKPVLNARFLVHLRPTWRDENLDEHWSWLGCDLVARLCSHQEKSRKMNEKKILRSVSADSAALSFPDGPVVISRLHIGRITEEFSVLVNGSQSTRSKDLFDFGLDAENSGTAPVLIGFTIARADADGFITQKHPASAVVQPGEKRRLWGDLRLENQQDFAGLILTDVWVEPASAQSGTTINPPPSRILKLNLHTLFRLHDTPLPFRLKQEHVVPLLIAVFVFCLFGYLSLNQAGHGSGSMRPVSEKERREQLEKRLIGRLGESAIRCDDGTLILSLDSVSTMVASQNGGVSSRGRLHLEWDAEPTTHVMNFRASSVKLEAARETDKEYLIHTNESGVQRFRSAAAACWGGSYTATLDTKAPIGLQVTADTR